MLDKYFMQLFFIAFLSTNTLHAETDADTILVTADRIKSTLDKSPSDIKVFEQAEIEKSTGITDLLSAQSDLQLIQSGPLGGNTSLFLRGSDSSHTLVIIDGIIMNDPSNPNRQFDLGRLSLNNVERIEILKGAQGLLYGSNAIGGVIVITTKKALDKTTGSAQVDYGTFDTLNSALNLQKKIHTTSFTMGIDHLKTRGFSAANINHNPGADDDGEKRTTLSAGLNHPLTKSNELVFNYRYVDDEVELDKGGGAGNDDPDDFQTSQQQFMKTGLIHNWSSAETNLFYTKTLHRRMLSTDSTVKTKGEIDTIAINHTQYTNDFLTQNINFDYQHEEDQRHNFNENLSFFLYNRLEYGPAVFNLGARLDSNKFFGEHLTYKAAVMHFFSKFTLKLNYSTGFRAPSLNQLYDVSYGNKNLNPEKSQSAEIGFDVPLGEDHKYLATFFYTDLHDRLSYDPITFINQNRGRAKILGVENNFSSKLSNELSAHLSLTWLSARDMTARQKLARRPNLNSKLNIHYKKESHMTSLEGDFTGKRPDVDNLGNTVAMPSYLIFNMNYMYDFNQSFSTYVKIKNLLDKNYEEVFGYGTGGRAAMLGLRYSF